MTFWFEGWTLVEVVPDCFDFESPIWTPVELWRHSGCIDRTASTRSYTLWENLLDFETHLFSRRDAVLRYRVFTP